MEIINLCYITPSFYPAIRYGGPIFSSIYMLRELPRCNVSVKVLTTNVNGSSRLNVECNKNVQLKEAPGIDVEYCKETFSNKFSFSMLLKMPLSIIRCEVVHAQSIFSLSTPLAILFSTILFKPIVISPRGSLGKWCLSSNKKLKRLWLKLFFQPFLKRIYWHVTADFEAQDLFRVFPTVEKETITVIPNGIHIEDHKYLEREQLFQKLQLQFQDEYILVMGRIDKKKGIDYTIESLKYVQNIHLVVAGPDYGEKNTLLELSSKLGLSGRVHFVGQVNGITKWSLYKHAVLFCMNSRHENFGNVYLESLSVGTPIIASINTPWEFINRTEAGLCVVNEPFSIGESIREMLSKESTLVSEACLEQCKLFLWETLAIEMANFYRKIVKKHE